MEITRFIIAAFAVYRLSRMVGLERGPFDIIAKWQNFVFERVQKPFNDNGGNGLHWFYDGITCPLCLSFYFGLIDAVAILFFPSPLVDFVNVWLALSGAASLLIKVER